MGKKISEPENINVDISKKSLTELQALAYKEIVQINLHQNNLKAVETVMAKKGGQNE